MTYPMAPFQLHHPDSIAEALALAAAHPGAPFLAGGTDLVVNLRKRLAEPEHVISLRCLSELGGVSESGGWLAIGARTTMTELATHPLLLRRVPVTRKTTDPALRAQLVGLLAAFDRPLVARDDAGSRAADRQLRADTE